MVFLVVLIAVMHVHGYGTKVASFFKEGKSAREVKLKESNERAFIRIYAEVIIIRVEEEVVILKSLNHMPKQMTRALISLP